MCAAAEAAARAAAAKKSRGWQAEQPRSEDQLPEPDLLRFQLSGLKQLLLEAAAFGCLLWQCEKSVEAAGYMLQPNLTQEEY